MFPNARIGKEVVSVPYADWQRAKSATPAKIGRGVHDETLNVFAENPEDKHLETRSPNTKNNEEEQRW